MSWRGNRNNQNQWTASRKGKLNFVYGGQVFQQQQAPSQGIPAPQTATPIQQSFPQAEQAPVQNMDLKPNVINPKEISTTNEIEKDKVETEKKSWMNRKIPNKEKIRRRNVRLSKLLQPKNALMILHELVKNPTFDVSDANGQFQAVVTVAGSQHFGNGKNKNAAKNAAAEAAIKYLLKHKNVEALDTSTDDDEKMETTESSEELPLPWQQVASFALYKLFDSWGEHPCQDEQPKQKKVNSARKMPDNPTSLNPVMLINQMYPHANFDEIQIGNPPNVIFTVQCKIDDQIFEGKGPSKKAAKKQAAYGACHRLLGIVYPPEQYTPSQ